jgi:4'-phosphopantetheinyl transferase EntD
MHPALADLFPAGVVVAGGPPALAVGELFPAETRLIEGAVAARRRDFTAGRLFARVALARLGVAPQPILARERRPLWPPGILGTITHAEGRCAAAVARRGEIVGVGLDVERADAVTPELHRHVLTAGERERLAALPAEDHARMATLTFSAKEAFYKSLAELALGFVGFDEVCIAHAADGSFTVDGRTAALGRALAGVVVRGRTLVEDRWLWTAVTLTRRA